MFYGFNEPDSAKLVRLKKAREGNATEQQTECQKDCDLRNRRLQVIDVVYRPNMQHERINR